MNLVYSWLKEFVDVDMPAVELAHVLTMLGLEVENLWLVGLPHPEGDNPGVTFHGLPWDKEKFVVARVDEVMPHPNADRLVLCRLNDGSEEMIVLTGAPNLYPYKGVGPLEKPLKVAYAREGARLYDGHKPGHEITTLKRMKIRGVESFSMICSEKELGISEEHEGVIILDPDAPEGTPLADYMGDAVFEVAILPNMVHCANMIGAAREIAAYLNKPLKMPDLSLPADGPPINGKFKITIKDDVLNRRFVAGLIEGVEAKPSPYYVQYRLRLAGQRPINAIVDATNYVMLEIGQPLHSFDYDVLVKRADGKTPHIITRTAEQGEKLKTLDEIDRSLDDFTELVTDTAGALAMAGVMGGFDSEVTEKTTNVLLEGASWNYINIRKTIAAQRINTEASYRFSRNVHPAIAEAGTRLGLLRMAAWGGGTIYTNLVDNYPNPYAEPTVTLTEDEIERMLGVRVSAKDAGDYLDRLGFICKVKGAQVSATAPQYRTDIGEGVIGKADVLEEIARHYSYDKLPATRLQAELPPQRGNALEERDRIVQDLLATLGLQEIISYRLTSPEAEQKILPAGSAQTALDYIELQNPIAVEKRVLRRSLLPSVLEAVEKNVRLRERLMLFEIGPVFLPVENEDLPNEEARLAIALTGLRQPSAWDVDKAGNFDVYDIKGVVEALLAGLQIKEYAFSAAENPSYHPGKSALLTVKGEAIGHIGEIHPLVMDNYDLLDAPVLAADLDLEKIFAQKPADYKAEPIPTYPPVIEDLAMIVPEETISAQIESLILKTGGFLLKSVDLFDIFHGEQIGEGKKSMAYRLTYQAPNRTLTDKDVGKLRARIIKALEKELDAKVRKAE